MSNEPYFLSERGIYYEEDMSKLRLYCPFMSKAMDKVCQKSRVFCQKEAYIMRRICRNCVCIALLCQRLWIRCGKRAVFSVKEPELLSERGMYYGEDMLTLHLYCPFISKGYG